MLTDQEVETLFAAGESDRVEFKEGAADLSRIKRTICALANDLPGNKRPGVVFVGVRNDGSCAGLTVDDELLQRLAQCRLDGSIIPFPTITVRRVVLRGCAVAAAIVNPSSNPPLQFDGRIWVRVGPSTARASAEEERILTERRVWGNQPFDMHGVVGATTADLDLERFRSEYLPAAVAQDVLIENARPLEQQLRALRFVRPDGVPTVTAILIIGKSPQDFIPGAYVQFIRASGADLTSGIVDEKVISGTIGDQIRQLDELVRLHIARSVEVGGPRASVVPEYPEEAIRQLVRNAVLHRNYDGTHSPVRVTWYDDRIEISSPGGPFGQVTKANFGSPDVTDYRNPTLAEALRNLRYVERFGLGIQIVQSSLKKNGNPSCEFRIEDTYVHATVRRRP